jgi:hypothetical protein
LLNINPEQRLGHRSIEEIINHPWFANHELSAEPPFVPALSSERDTRYFEQRYEFDPATDASVLKDLQEFDGVPPPPPLSSFSGVSLTHLLRANGRVAQNLALRSSRRRGTDALMKEANTPLFRPKHQPAPAASSAGAS